MDKKELRIWGDILADLTKLLGLGIIPDERIQAAAEFADLTRMKPAVLADGRELDNLVVHDVTKSAFFRQGLRVGRMLSKGNCLNLSFLIGKSRL